jgi:hypothetical protein
MTPTREQLEQARHELEGLALDPFGLPTAKRKALAALLAATAPPTDEVLAKEAVWAGAGLAAGAARFRQGYIAGARREGRR